MTSVITRKGLDSVSVRVNQAITIPSGGWIGISEYIPNGITPKFALIDNMGGMTGGTINISATGGFLYGPVGAKFTSYFVIRYYY